MSKRESIERLNLIVSFLRRNAATFKEILTHLESKSILNDYDYSISQKTFKRDLELIAELMKIEIEFDHSIKKYKIIAEEKSEISLRITEAFETFNALKLADDISNFIIFEKRKAIGTEHLNSIIYAIKNKKVLQFEYQKYWHNNPEIRSVIPLALKENKHRWYLVATDEKTQIVKSFGLDRMNEVQPTSMKFEYPTNINIEEKFKNCFGIISDDHYEAVEIKLSFTPFQAKYIKSLPLHHSQQIISDNEEECVIKLFLKPTEDIIMEILSLGANVKVLEPASLKNEISKRLKNVLAQYEI
jgi:predicted DNA-binding transcriptional regulator YafY